MKQQNIWKILSILFLLTSVALLSYIVLKKNKSKLGEMSLEDIDRDAFESNKKQNPTFAEDNNDYFFKNQTKIKFLQDLYDYDTIVEGKELVRTIKFVNQGKEPYFITEVKVSCGCTIPSYDKEPVKPGDTGKIQILFKSKGKDGFSMNKLSLFGNTAEKENSTYFKVFVNKTHP